jgi:hypothetical protein
MGAMAKIFESTMRPIANLEEEKLFKILTYVVIKI